MSIVVLLFWQFFDATHLHSNKKMFLAFLNHGNITVLYPEPYLGQIQFISTTWKMMPCSINMESSHVLCSYIPTTMSSDPTCGTNKFQCLDGSCILRSYLCDGHPDCLSSEDEAEEDCHTTCTHQTSGESLSYQSICRLNCTKDQCKCNPSSQFQCHQGGCIHFSLLCNHRADCPYDSSDEIYCPQSSFQKECLFVIMANMCLCNMHMTDCSTVGMDQMKYHLASLDI